MKSGKQEIEIKHSTEFMGETALTAFAFLGVFHIAFAKRGISVY